MLPLGVINSCFNPVSIELPNGRRMMVPCNKCEACLQQRSDRLVTRINDESLEYPYKFFLTLTYDNAHLPRLKYNPKTNCFNPTYTTDRYVEHTCTYEQAREVLEVAQITNDRYKQRYGDSFAVCSRRDVQLFLKRLRYHLSYFYCKYLTKQFERDLNYLNYLYGFTPIKSKKSIKTQYIEFLNELFDTDESLYFEYEKSLLILKANYYEKKSYKKDLFRYFIVSEYSPELLRPHYHGLIFTKVPEVANILRQAAFKSWKKCNYSAFECEPVRGSASKYVAQYINSYIDLPKILQSKPFRPFYLCSQSPAFGYQSFDFEKLQDMYVRGVDTESRRVFTKDGFKDVNVSIPAYVINRYFPLAKGYSTLSDSEKLRLYSIFTVKRYEKVGKAVVSRYDDEKSWYYTFWLKRDLNLYKKVKYGIDGLVKDVLRDCDIDPQTLRAAAACRRWCQHFGCTPDHYLRVLDWFRYRRSMRNLADQYTLMEEYCSDVGNAQPFINMDQTIFEELPAYLPTSYKADYWLLGRKFESFGIMLEDLYDRDGYIKSDYVASLREQNTFLYQSYRNQIMDRVKQAIAKKQHNDTRVLHTHIY